MRFDPFRAHRAALSSSCALSPTTRLVWLALVAHADVGGECWPGLETLAAETGCGRSTVVRSLTELRKSGWLTVRRGARNSNLYRLLRRASAHSGQAQPGQAQPGTIGASVMPTVGLPVCPQRDPNYSENKPADPDPPVVPKGKQKGRRTECPDDLQAAGRTLVLIAEYGLTPAEVSQFVASCVGWYRRKGELGVDWQAALRGWIARDLKRDGRRPIDAEQAAKVAALDVERRAACGLPPLPADDAQRPLFGAPPSAAPPPVADRDPDRPVARPPRNVVSAPDWSHDPPCRPPDGLLDRIRALGASQ